MYRLLIYTTILCMLVAAAPLHAQGSKTDANLVGHVLNQSGAHIPFVAISVEGTTIGSTSDETGHFKIVNLPEGTYTIKANFVGYKSARQEVNLQPGVTLEVNFTLEEDLLGLEEAVVTGDRNETNRTGASVIVTKLSSKTFNLTQSVTLSEGLNFCPGLRTENNCQNCGFTQVRMNGMEGPYSQILINGRPIFSGLAGVYGLELIPSNMVERVEVIRGGGSALYGSSAIAGTINLILKDPVNNGYEFHAGTGAIGLGLKNSGTLAPDHMVNFNTSLLSSDSKTGMALFGFHRDRGTFDANNDGFSELTTIKNTTIGARLFHRFGTRNKINTDFFNIKEERRGGDRFDYPLHMANIAEAVTHNITTGALTYDHFFREKDKMSLYLSGQGIKRDSYYGALQSLKDYGFTQDFTHTIGVQYNASLGISNIIFGAEQIGSVLTDKKLGYPDIEGSTYNPTDSTINIDEVGTRIISNQSSLTTGSFLQYEMKQGKWKITGGLRYDIFRIENKLEKRSPKIGQVISPRVTLRYSPVQPLQLRASYGQGYRAPQIFDEDLHIHTSEARKVLHRNHPDLDKELSHTYMASADFNHKLSAFFFSLLVESFYTRLNNAFSNDYGEPDEDGVVEYTRVNAENGAVVKGINMEINLATSDKLKIQSGFTLQDSRYQDEHEFGEKRFFRTPGDYGYLTLDLQPLKNSGIALSGTYTGQMLLPYFGNMPGTPEEGELRITPRFYDMGIKLHRNIRLNGASLQIYAGVKNLLNSYQKDFDFGGDRDPAYMYGPGLPRMVYGGIKLGNMLR